MKLEPNKCSVGLALADISNIGSHGVQTCRFLNAKILLLTPHDHVLDQILEADCKKTGFAGGKARLAGLTLLYLLPWQPRMNNDTQSSC
jgi:hypothetical protein